MLLGAVAVVAVITVSLSNGAGEPQTLASLASGYEGDSLSAIAARLAA